MTMSTRFSAVAVVSALSLVVSACGGAGNEDATSTSSSVSGYEFGSPAERADADRTVEITAVDSFAFEPTELTVTAGETITFHIVNEGTLVHDFTLGDQATQDEHEAEIAERGVWPMTNPTW